MIEIIKILVDILTKIIDPEQIKKHDKEKQLQKLGRPLFLLYIELNKLLVNGEKIINNLQEYVRRMEDDTRKDKERYVSYIVTWLGENIRNQAVLVREITKLIISLREELQILDAYTYYRLELFLDIKLGVLRYLIYILEEERFVIPSDKLLTFLTPPLEEFDSASRKMRSASSIFTALEGLTESSSPPAKDWNESTYQKIKDYLTDRNPSGQLNDLTKNLEKLHDVLEANFSVQDMLLFVSQRER